jgi:hypothetical protein
MRGTHPVDAPRPDVRSGRLVTSVTRSRVRCRLVYGGTPERPTQCVEPERPRPRTTGLSAGRVGTESGRSVMSDGSRGGVAVGADNAGSRPARAPRTPTRRRGCCWPEQGHRGVARCCHGDSWTRDVLATTERLSRTSASRWQPMVSAQAELAQAWDLEAAAGGDGRPQLMPYVCDPKSARRFVSRGANAQRDLSSCHNLSLRY